MKNLFIKLSVIAGLVIACSQTFAVYPTYTDTHELSFLAHFDTTSEPWWLETPDDNSSGLRVARQLILNNTNAPTFAKDFSTVPTLMSGAPNGSSYFNFNGSNSTIYIPDAWAANETDAICDFTIRWLGLPANLGSDLEALVQNVSWRCYLDDDQKISFLCGSTWLKNDFQLSSNVWYDVHYQNIDGNAMLTIVEPDGTENVKTGSQTLGSGGSQVMIGYDVYQGNRFFYGDLDEVRVGTVPEPITFGILGLLGFFIIRRK